MEGVIGFTTLFAGNFAPRNWALCQGQTLSIAQNTALFSILGVNYGGDGKTTFGLPNLIGRQVVGAGQAPGQQTNYGLGQTAGMQGTTISAAQMPAHTHALVYTATLQGGTDANSSAATDAFYGTDSSGGTPYAFGANVALAPFQGTLTTTANGDGLPVSIQNPVLGLNYVICLYGIFPSRD